MVRKVMLLDGFENVVGLLCASTTTPPLTQGNMITLSQGASMICGLYLSKLASSRDPEQTGIAIMSKIMKIRQEKVLTKETMYKMRDDMMASATPSASCGGANQECLKRPASAIGLGTTKAKRLRKKPSTAGANTDEKTTASDNEKTTASDIEGDDRTDEKDQHEATSTSSDEGWEVGLPAHDLWDVHEGWAVLARAMTIRP